jgi:Right handed beta helix region/Pectinesterase
MSTASSVSAGGPTSLDRYESTFVVSQDPSKGDFASLQQAIDALPASGGKIFVKAGIYSISGTIQIRTSNVHVQGEGMGTTVFVADGTMTGNTPALEAFSTVLDGAPQPLLADPPRGEISIRIAATDPSVFAPGDNVLLYSNKEIDTESPAKHAGELKQVTKWDATTGILTMDDQIFDVYTQADSAQVVRVTGLRNITLSDFSITTNALSSTLKVGFTHFRFIDNLQIERVEVHDAYFSGMQLQSIRNSVVCDCYIHHINDIVPVNPPNPANERYGIAIGGASQNVSVRGCRFSHTRHAVTTGGSSGKNQNGVQRNIVVSNCTSMLSDTAHFDTHQPAENVTFIGCVADGGLPVGGLPPTGNVCGFQMRGRNSSIVGCSVLQAIGRGIMIFGPASSGAVISGNMISRVRAVHNNSGTGIYFDSQGTSNHSVIGNVIKDCEGSAIANGGSNNDIVISGNVIANVNSIVAGAAIELSEAARILVFGNNVSASGPNRAIAMLGNSDNWQIAGNSLGGVGGVALAGAGSFVTNNVGYNPVGVIVNPWPSTSTDLTNDVTAGNATPQSGVVYTVRHTPKTIVVAGGNVSAIRIDGADTGLAAGNFKLGVGETIAIFYGTSAPTTQVFAE